MPAATTPDALARHILARLRADNHSAYLVGGCVRDLLLGRPPKDFDVATSARPDQILELFPGSDLVGAHFGVVVVRRHGQAVEVATYRTDHDYRDGRRPSQVSFLSTPKADAERRDFTINALLLDPDSGQVLDFTGGQADLAARLIRTVGDPVLRFEEDHLRLLRAIRFAARFSFAIHPDTFAAIRQLAALIRDVAPERVRDELNRILVEGGARHGFELLDESGLLPHVLPEISAMKGVEQPAQFHPEGDVWTHTLLMLEGLRHPTSALAWGVLLHDVAKPPTFRVAERIRFDGHAALGARMARDILSRLRLPNDDIHQVESLVRHHLHFIEIPHMRQSTLKRFLRLPRFDEHLELHRLDCMSSHRNLDNYHFAVQKLAETPPEQLRPPRLITGDDLIRLGLTPGPRFREILEAVETAQLESRIHTHEEALALAGSMGGHPTA